MDEKVEIALIVILLIAALFVWGGSTTANVVKTQSEPRITAVNHADFSRCLSKNGIIVYTNGNEASLRQLEMFGNAVVFIQAVDCSLQEYVCKTKGISTLPTWEIFGKRYVGIIPLGELSDITGCKL